MPAASATRLKAPLPGICLATILDASRLPSLLLLRGAWHGELSAAVLGRVGEPLEAQRAWLASAVALELSLLARAKGERRFRLVDGRVLEASGAQTRVLLLENTGFDCPHRFPYNMLRNMAFLACRSQIVLVLDVNVVPLPASAEGYRELQRLVAKPVQAAAASSEQQQVLKLRRARKLVWVLPVFEITPLGEETVRQGATTLHSKAAFKLGAQTAKHELRKMVRDGLAAPFYSGSRAVSVSKSAELAVGRGGTRAASVPLVTSAATTAAAAAVAIAGGTPSTNDGGGVAASATRRQAKRRVPKRDLTSANSDVLQPTNLSFHKAYKCTDYQRWLQLPKMADRYSSAYPVRHCTGHYEPFVMLHKQLVLSSSDHASDGPRSRTSTTSPQRRLLPHPRQPFDTSFVRGFDKVSFTYELFALNATFLVAPSHFLMHLPTPADETVMAPASVTSRAFTFSSLLRQPLPSSPHRFQRRTHTSLSKEATRGGASNGGGGGGGSSSSSEGPNQRGDPCRVEPVRDWIRPFADMPGWTCIDQFLTRMAKQHNYVPRGADHGSLRRWASRWRGRCHTDPQAMRSLFRRSNETTGAGGASGTEKSSSSTSLSSSLTSLQNVTPDGIGMPQRSPKVVEALGNFSHVPNRPFLLSAFALNTKNAKQASGYLRGGDCYGPQNMNFSCWAAHLAFQQPISHVERHSHSTL